MSNERYTPAPWRFEPSTMTIRNVPGNHWLASMDSWDGAVDSTANARRIVACVNACEGIPTEVLEGTGKNLIQTAPDMRDILEELLNEEDELKWPELVATARKIIAKSKGETV